MVRGGPVRPAHGRRPRGALAVVLPECNRPSPAPPSGAALSHRRPFSGTGTRAGPGFSVGL